MSTRTVYDHINDTSIHFKINDGNVSGALNEVYSSAKLNADFIKKNAAGSSTKFFNELGQAVEVNIKPFTKIDGGIAQTKFV